MLRTSILIRMVVDHAPGFDPNEGELAKAAEDRLATLKELPAVHAVHVQAIPQGQENLPAEDQDRLAGEAGRGPRMPGPPPEPPTSEPQPEAQP